MKTRNFGLFGFVGALALVLGAALSTSEARAATVAALITNISDSDGAYVVDFSGFDSSLGTLLSSTVNVQGWYTAILTPYYPEECTVVAPCTVQVHNSFGVDAGGSVGFSRTYDLGTSTETYTGGANILENIFVDKSITTPGSVFWVGYGGFSLASVVSINPDLSYYDFMGDASVIYDYIPTPEPTSLALIASGLVSLINVRRRKRHSRFVDCNQPQ
jgi:hypothetical protein